MFNIDIDIIGSTECVIQSHRGEYVVTQRSDGMFVVEHHGFILDVSESFAEALGHAVIQAGV